ncbi:MAG: PqqD family protein [Actinobacteria bacterium]|nr:PqqD family protein [Actinomycetota bacterium]
MDASERSFSPAPGVLAQRVGAELVLVHPETNQIYALNETGASLWELLAGGATRAALVDGLAERFDGDTEEIETEVPRLLVELELHGLLTGE